MKKSYKFLSIILAVLISVSSFAGMAFSVVAAANAESVISIAEQYVIKNQNNVTRQGLLEAVKAEYPSVTLAESDFYILHAVNGVKDDTTDYALNIAGSDGAVAAVFTDGANRIGFSEIIPQRQETIHISETAIVGQSDGFTYDNAGNVTGYTGTADKMVFPTGYTGTAKPIENKSSINNIKVLIYNGNTAFVSSGFSDWDGLVAVQMGNQTNTSWGFSITDGRATSTFYGCDSLKYFKFVDWINSGSYWNAVFPTNFLANCPRLETVVLPKKYNGLGQLENGRVNYGASSFGGTAVREFVIPQDISVDGVNTPKDGYITSTFGSASFAEGTRNVELYAGKMTFVRAVALAASSLNRLNIALTSESEMKATANAAIVGSADASAFANTLSYVYSEDSTDIETKKMLTVSNGTDKIPIKVSKINTLLDLSVTDATVSPSFNAKITDYETQVSNKTTSLAVTATAVEGATVVSVNGNSDLKIGKNTVTVTVKTAYEKTVIYTIQVDRAEFDFDDVLASAKSYVVSKKNTATAEGLLLAAKAVLPEIELKAENFYIRHAVNGVKDDTKSNQLNIAGSNGAVAAIFEYKGKSYGFSAAFPFETEIIKINETAIVGTSAGFTYDGNKNVTAYNGTADKIVFPNGYNGTMTALADMTAAKKVKVLIYNGQSPFVASGFADWDGLIAVQMGDQTNNQWGFKITNNRAANIFYGCDNLKYFKFCNWMTSGDYYNSVFPSGFLSNCPKLETVILPNKYNGLGQLDSGKIEYGANSFNGTAIREFVMMQDIAVGDVNTPKDTYLTSTFGNAGYGEGTRNIHFYAEKMTFVRAAALAAANLYNKTDADTQSKLETAVEKSVVGAADAAAMAQAFTYKFNKSENKYLSKYELTVTYKGTSVPLFVEKSKTLWALSVEKHEISPSFDPETLKYAVTVPNKVSSINVIATAVNGATVKGVDGNTNLSVGENTVTVSVTSSEGKNVDYVLTVTREAPPDETEISINKAAKDYVKNLGNEATAEGLLAAVREVVPTATLDIQNDFYILHAVNGVKDDTTEYKLNIEGSDGAVAAVFENNGKRYGFTAALTHSTELVKIKETAVVGKSEGFTYDTNGNVTAYNGTADKLVFPDGYNGTMTELENLDSVQNIRVLIYNGNKGVISGSFMDWDGLIAVQIGNQTNTQWGFNITQNRDASSFSGCDNLKYFKFCNWLNSSSYYNAVFPTNFLGNCPKLETVILPDRHNGLGQLSNGVVQYGEKSFFGTSVREFVLSQDIAVGDVNKPNENYKTNTFGGAAYNAGTTNVHLYSEKMTYMRAVALAAAAVNELDYTASSADAMSAAISGIKGSADAAKFAKTLTVGVEEEWEDTDFSVSGKLTVTNGRDALPIYFNASKSLKQLDVGYDLSPSFSPDVTSYEVSVGNKVTELSINAVPVDGAKVVSINGNGNFEVGTPKDITVEVLTASEKTVTFTVKVTRRPIPVLDESVMNRIQSYAALFNGTNYSDKTDFALYLSAFHEIPDISVKTLDFYRYNSIPGAKTDDTVIVEGRTGYISSVIEVSNGVSSEKFTVTAPIIPYVKDYHFTEKQISNPKDFSVSDDGTTLEYYQGDAELIILPKGISYIDSGWYNGEYPQKVKAVIVPDSVMELPMSFTYGMTHLEACYLGNNITELPSSTFMRCYYLQFVHLPETVESIGYGAFMFAMSLPELYMPATVQTISTKSFWSCGNRNFNLPKGMTSISDTGICYPLFRGGIWNEPTAMTAQEAAEITEIMNSYQFYNNNLVITYFGNNLVLESGGAMGGTSQQVTGAIVEVRTPKANETTVFKDRQQAWTHYHFDLDMSICELISRAQFAADNAVIYDDATASDVEAIIADSIYSVSDVGMTWETPFEVEDNRMSGVLVLSKGDCTGKVVFDRTPYMPPEMPEGVVLKGDRTNRRLTLKDDEEPVTPDEEEVVDYDSLDDEKEIEVKKDNKDTIVKINIKKLKKSDLSDALIKKLDGFAYVPFKLSVTSTKTVKLNGKLAVAVPLPKGFEASRCHIYYIGKNGKLIDMKAKKNGNKLVLNTSELGNYVLVQDVDDYSTLITVLVIVGAGVLVIAAGLVAFVLIRKKKKK